jgi:hypothetical protein
MEHKHTPIPWTEEARIKVGRTRIEKDLTELQIPSEIEAFKIGKIVISNDGGNIAKILYLLGENMKSVKPDNKWFLRLALSDSLDGLYEAAMRDYQNPITLAAIFFKMAAELDSEIGKIKEDKIKIEYQYKG